MTTKPSIQPPATTSGPPPSPVPDNKSPYNSAYVQIENFIFNPALVTGFLHRAAANAESVAVTELLYGSHHVIIEDKQRVLFNHMCHHTKPGKPTTTI